ncbi:hypothetical protein ACFL0H_00200 [Thermodesulfobacteriota bacterium]
MEESKEFLIFRYSLIEELQRSLITAQLPDPKGAAIVCAIDKDREFVLNAVLYSFVGFSSIKPITGYEFPADRFYVGKTAKLRKISKGEKIPGDIVEHQEDDWVPLLTIFDIYDQYIFVRKDWRFGTPEQVARAIQRGLRDPVLEKYNHKVFIEGKVRKDAFWDVVDKFTKIYKVELKLISPNILETNKKAREALKSLKELFEQDEIDLTLSNDSGHLKVPKEPVSDYIDYVSGGEGSWSIVTEGERGGKKRHSSVENTLTVDLPVFQHGIVEEQKELEVDSKDPTRMSTMNDARMVAEIYRTVKNINEL